VFPVRYELNLYMLFRRNFVFKGLICISYAICPDPSPILYERRALKRARCIESCTPPLFSVNVCL
jgi:hypothetical protein